MSALDSLEQRLTAAYRMQQKLYDDAIAIINVDAQTLEMDAWVSDLHSALSEVAMIDAHMARDKVAWEESGGMPGYELKGILTRVATQIRTLTGLIDRRSEELVARKQRLVPVLDDFIRQRYMLQSYGKFGSMK